MYRRLPESNDAVIGYEVSGALSTDDVKAMHREIDHAIREHGRIRLLVDIDDMSAPEPGAVIEDLKLTPEYIGKVEKYAIIGDSRWHDLLARATALVSKGDARHFERQESAAAWAWLRD